MKEENNFRARVCELVAQIPRGRLMTYGQIAALCGNPRAARIVGRIAHLAPCSNLATCNASRRTDLGGVQGTGEQRSKSYRAYDERAEEPVTQQSAKSINRVSGSARKQVNAVCLSCDLPWQRVVKKDGHLAEGFPGGIEGHRQVLKAEGVKVSKGLTVDIKGLIWRP